MKKAITLLGKGEYATGELKKILHQGALSRAVRENDDILSSLQLCKNVSFFSLTLHLRSFLSRFGHFKLGRVMV